MQDLQRNGISPPISEGLLRDAALLVSTAKHLRWLAWYRLVTGLGLVLLIVMSHAQRVPPKRLIVISVIYGAVSLGSAGLAFLLAYFVRRAELWAVVLSLFVGLFSLGVTMLTLFSTPPFQIVMIVIETAFLIFSLTLVRQAYHCIGAAQRIQTAVLPPIQALPADESAEWRHAGSKAG